MLKKIYNYILNFFITLLNLFVVLGRLPQYFFVKIKYKDSDISEIHIIGNGPSLSKDIEPIQKLSQQRNKYSFFCVNGFCITNYFFIIKPNYYIFTDISFFKRTDIERIDTFKNKIINSFSEVNWRISVFVPVLYKNSSFVNSLKKNKYVEIIPFSYAPLWGGFDAVNVFFYKLGLGTIPFQNVLAAAIFQSIKMGFKKIYIWGADHSWVENYFVGSDNVMYTYDKHFNDKSNDHYFAKLNIGGENTKVHEEFASLSKTFKSYFLLKRFAENKGIAIFNCSSKSWIDAFDRIDSSKFNTV